MKVIHADHIGEAFKKGIQYLVCKGEMSTSRNGTVLRAPYPVTTIYKNPRLRVLVNPARRANPFFHLMESLWMLAGRNDVAWVARFNKRMTEYSDDGVLQPAAYGHRWKNHFGIDQLDFVVNELKRTEFTSRRAVITMADPRTDIVNAENGGVDLPCNTTIYFLWRAHGALDMTVCNRSNDAIWGCYGANVVHFSMLHEYIAARLGGVWLGRYYQMSNDLHAYTDIYPIEKLKEMAFTQNTFYPERPMPLLQSGEEMIAWHDDLFEFMHGKVGAFNTEFFNGIVIPMLLTWEAWKRRDMVSARIHCGRIQSDDWRKAALVWIEGARK